MRAGDQPFRAAAKNSDTRHIREGERNTATTGTGSVEQTGSRASEHIPAHRGHAPAQPASENRHKEHTGAECMVCEAGNHLAGKQVFGVKITQK